MRRGRSGLVLAAIAVLADRPASAADDPRPRLSAARRTGPIEVDGVLAEADWGSAPANPLSFQREPEEGEPPTQPTEFRLLYDDSHLYIAVAAGDRTPDLIDKPMSRRDAPDAFADSVFVYIDSYRDRRTAFVFSVSAAGVQRDAVIYDDARWDDSWNAVWQSAVSLDEGGWNAELAIPLSQLRFERGDPVWGFQVARVIQRRHEAVFWAPWPNAAAGRVSLFGDLEGLYDLPPPRQLEILPYALAGVERDPTGSEALWRAGLDAKYGLGSNLTLVATVNPDFGQVEADPSTINLTADEIFVAERRPFFLEGAELFRIPLASEPDQVAPDTLFYSRRIGALPHGVVAGSGAPDPVTLYGAAKLSGKSAGGLAVGALTAVTGQESAVVEGARMLTEPLTSYSVVRAEQDLAGGRATVGGAATAVVRPPEDARRLALNDQAWAGSLDLTVRPADDWRARFKLIGSTVRGAPEAIARTQASSARYFQRPDASHVELDPARESLGGASLFAHLLKEGGQDPMRGGIGAHLRTPGFEVNDLGFQPLADTFEPWLWLQYRDDQAPAPLLSYKFNASSFAYSDLEPRLLRVMYGSNVHALFRNRWGAHLNLFGFDARWDTRALRGGPALRQEDVLQFYATGISDDRRAVRANLIARGSYQPVPDSRSLGGDLLLAIRPADPVDLALGPTIDWRVDDAQYIGTFEDGAGTPRYLVGRIDQTTLALTLRVNLGLTARMTLEGYAQPFVSSGRYREHKEVVDPDATSYRDRFHVLGPGEVERMGGELVVDREADGAPDYRLPEPDFRFRELRSNLVYRWEVSPGSTFFVIWSHAGASRVADAGLAGDDVGALFDQPAGDVVLVKLSYWFGL